MARLLRSLLVILLATLTAACSSAPSVAGGTSLNGVIRMIDAQHGWAYGRQLLARTSDGAVTFRTVTPPLAAGAQLDEPLFLDADHAFVFAIQWDGSTLKSSSLERTSDGGATWQTTTMSPAMQGDLTFFDPMHGWLVSGVQSTDHLSMTDTLFRTVDGGASWTSLRSTTYRIDVHPSTQPGGCHWSGSIAWMSATHGIVGVGCPFDAVPAVDVTNDAGSTWTRERVPPLLQRPGVTLFSSVGPVHVFAGGHLTALVSRCAGPDGMSCTPYEELYRSDDGGATWTGGAVLRGGELLSVDFDHAWTTGCMDDACVNVGLLATSDAGAHWQGYPLRSELEPNMHGSRVFSFVSGELGFASADNEFQKAAGYFKTTDGGRTFAPIQPLLES